MVCSIWTQPAKKTKSNKNWHYCVYPKIQILFFHNFLSDFSFFFNTLFSQNDFLNGKKCTPWNDITLPLLCGWQISLSKIDKIFPLAIPNHIIIISMHIPTLVTIHLHFLKSLSWKENMDRGMTDRWQTNGHINGFSTLKRKYGQMDDRQMTDKWTYQWIFNKLGMCHGQMYNRWMDGWGSFLYCPSSYVSCQ